METTLVYIVCGIWFVGAVVAVLLMGYADKQRQPNSITDLPREIQDWLNANNYVLRATEKTFRGKGAMGPFAGKMSIVQDVYRIVISEQGSEKRRVAWIKLEDSPYIAERLIVIWEDEWRPQEPPIE